MLAFPVITVQACEDFTAGNSAVSAFGHYDAAIFISSNAVQFGLALLNASQRTQLQQLTLGAIGSKTARKLTSSRVATGLEFPRWALPAKIF